MIACLKCGFPYCNVDPNSPQKDLKNIQNCKTKNCFSFKREIRIGGFSKKK